MPVSDAKQHRSAFLSSHSVQDVLETNNPTKPQVIDVNMDTTVSDVLELLNEHGISLLPIYELSVNDCKVYKGVVGAFDLLSYIAFQPEADTSLTKDPTVNPHLLSHTLREAFIHRKEDSRPNLPPCKIIKPTESLENVVALFAGGPYRQRVLVEAPNVFGRTSSPYDIGALPVPEDGPPRSPGLATQIRVLTQGDLLAYLNAHAEELGAEIMERTVRSGIMNRVLIARTGSEYEVIHQGQPFTVNLRCSALLAFKKMWAHRVGAIGLVDDQKKLVQVLSSTDLRNLTESRLPQLTSLALAYIEHLDHPDGRPSIPVTCQPECTFRQVMSNLVKRRCHRAFVVDENERPVGVVSISDLLSVLVA